MWVFGLGAWVFVQMGLGSEYVLVLTYGLADF